MRQLDKQRKKLSSKYSIEVDLKKLKEQYESAQTKLESDPGLKINFSEYFYNANCPKSLNQAGEDHEDDFESNIESDDSCSSETEDQSVQKESKKSLSFTIERLLH